MNIQAIAWDIDGTLIDSEPLHLESLLAICKFHNVDISDLTDDCFVGVNLFDVWETLKNRFRSDVVRDDWIVEINSYYAAHAYKMSALPGAVETVKALHRAGLPQVAVSNSNRSVVDANLLALGLDEILSWSLSLDDVAPKGKPDPFPYMQAAKHLGFKPSSIAAVEDSFTGVTSAKAAGLYVFALSPDGKIVSTADRTIASLNALQDHLLQASTTSSWWSHGLQN